MGRAPGKIARTSGILDETRKRYGEDGWNRGVVLWLWLNVANRDVEINGIDEFFIFISR